MFWAASLSKDEPLTIKPFSSQGEFLHISQIILHPMMSPTTTVLFVKVDGNKIPIGYLSNENSMIKTNLSFHTSTRPEFTAEGSYQITLLGYYELKEDYKELDSNEENEEEDLSEEESESEEEKIEHQASEEESEEEELENKEESPESSSNEEEDTKEDIPSKRPEPFQPILPGKSQKKQDSQEKDIKGGDSDSFDLEGPQQEISENSSEGEGELFKNTWEVHDDYDRRDFRGGRFRGGRGDSRGRGFRGDRGSFGRKRDFRGGQRDFRGGQRDFRGGQRDFRGGQRDFRGGQSRGGFRGSNRGNFDKQENKHRFF
ncbi:unnamed protein product [Blepharisma stoltei]|uniref:Nucleoplasmin-like domain-containing protein n=1 Tax=Blepharisma stoltei TaxID=1481888 RepID=A0AAU9J6E0_9CILI|nr:unnamed protein product [Blepharisma stoltei]